MKNCPGYRVDAASLDAEQRVRADLLGRPHGQALDARRYAQPGHAALERDRQIRSGLRESVDGGGPPGSVVMHVTRDERGLADEAAVAARVLTPRGC